MQGEWMEKRKEKLVFWGLVLSDEFLSNFDIEFSRKTSKSKLLLPLSSQKRGQGIMGTPAHYWKVKPFQRNTNVWPFPIFDDFESVDGNSIGKKKL